MIMRQPDTQENSRHTIQLDNIIGGQDFKHLSLQNRLHSLDMHIKTTPYKT